MSTLWTYLELEAIMTKVKILNKKLSKNETIRTIDIKDGQAFTGILCFKGTISTEKGLFIKSFEDIIKLDKVGSGVFPLWLDRDGHNVRDFKEVDLEINIIDRNR